MSDPIKQRKADLRKEIQGLLHSLGPDERRSRSAEVCRRLVQLEAFRHASTVMMYMPMPTEVDVTPVALRCFQLGMTVCVPRVDWKRRDMAAVEVTSFDDQSMDVDERGIRTPRDGRPILPSVIDMLIMPGLAFDTRGNRLGRGGGFYDRFLTRVGRHAVRVAVAFEEQVVQGVPSADSDMTVDVIVTDRRTTRVAGAHVR